MKRVGLRNTVSGVYYVRLISGSRSLTATMVVAR
jgi:hypothetical protein